jgi:hypothetical protein
MRTIVIVVAAAVAALSVYAANVEGRSPQDRSPYVYGAGASSCGEWTQERQGQDWYSLGQWVLGFVSARSNSGLLRQVDSNAIAGWIDNYCREHPLDRLKRAADVLVAELHR